MLEPSTSSNWLLTISIIIPTLNSAKTLKNCLESIAIQEYPEDKAEIIVADAGSKDGTLNIINYFIISNQSINIKLVPNPLKTGEAGKAAGIKHVKNDIIAFIDSDNILPDKDWLKRMVEPFDDQEIVASEPIEYTYRANDGYITRYCALLGMNDPLCLFLGNYDRYCVLTGKWTEMPSIEEDKGAYLKIGLDKKYLPTIGANGFLIRRSVLEKCNIGDYLYDIDVIYELLNSSNLTDPIRIAKVKTGIIHIFSGNVKTFAKKQKRRVRDYLFYNKLGVRKYPWKVVNKMKLEKFILFCLLIIPLLFQSYKGYIKRTDRAWFFHPLACWITLWEYGWGRISGIFGLKELKREEWRQCSAV
jgi:glycosyltransferase involved in cell wall biosynthesis